MEGEVPGIIRRDAGLAKPEDASPERLTELHEAQRAWTLEHFEKARPPEIKAVGFKTKLYDLGNPKAYAQLLREQNAAIIHNTRRNMVKLTVSQLNSQVLQKQVGRLNRLEGDPDVPPLEVSTEKFLKLLYRMTSLQQELGAYVESLGLPTIKVRYEDVFGGPDRVLGDICDFLGVERSDYTVRVRKVTKDNLREALSNYDELKQAVAGTEFEAMFT